MPYDNLSLLVSSCDKYAVCWIPFCHGLNKYWPEHPDRVYFITNQLNPPCGTAIKISEDRGWAGNLLHALDLIETDFILYAQEDYWIQSRVNQRQIDDYMQILESNQADYIRLYPAPGPDLPFPLDPRLGIISPGSEYRASLQMALWRKKTLLSLIETCESPWEFEVKGSYRTKSNTSGYLCVTRKNYGIDYVFTAVVNGYWSPKAYEYASKEGMEIKFETLPRKKFTARLKDRIIGYLYPIKKRLLR